MEKRLLDGQNGKRLNSEYKKKTVEFGDGNIMVRGSFSGKGMGQIDVI